MKNTLECHDFWMEDAVAVLLGQGVPTDEQVYVYEGQGEGGWSNIQCNKIAPY